MPIHFKFLMLARFFSRFAVEMQAVVLGWRVLELTHDPLYFGLIGLAEAVPALGMALHAGDFVDRSRPLIVMRGVMLVSLLSTLNMFFAQDAYLSPALQVAMLFSASLCTGAARSFSQPASYALVPRLVERQNLSRASAWMTAVFQIARVSGPAFGGWFLARTSMAGATEVVGAVLLLALITLYCIPAAISPIAEQPATKSRAEEFFSGAKYVARHTILLPALTLDMVSVLFAGATAMLPIYAADILRVGPGGLGDLQAASGFGAMLISVLLVGKGIRTHAGAWLFTAVSGFGICTIVFALSHDFSMSMVALGLSGAFDSISVVIRSAAVQLSSPDSMRGRISAVNSIFIGSSNEIGRFESGVAAKLMGTVPSVVFGGGMCLLTAVVVAVLSPALRRLDLGKLEEEHRKAGEGA
ncbi:MAG TPA: MFS transporter [Planctomycetota bacterium]|nr:MFS transporter [Planctomycetota bacterium]